MRTTVRIDDALFREVKVLGARTGKSFTTLIAEALRDLVHRPAQPKARRPFRLITSKGKLQPGVNLDDTSALLDLVDEAEASAAPRR